MDLPVMPPLEPMLARLRRDLPLGEGCRYEPKWDGFRCLVFRDGDEVVLQSRNLRPLTRYFPEVVEGVRQLDCDRVVLDGELLTEDADFDALLKRLHPSPRPRRRLLHDRPAGCLKSSVLGASHVV